MTKQQLCSSLYHTALSLHVNQLLPAPRAAVRYAENQALLGSADQLVAEQADLIRQLEARLLEAEGAAGRSQAARIAELQQQVVALQVTGNGRPAPAQHSSNRTTNTVSTL